MNRPIIDLESEFAAARCELVRFEDRIRPRVSAAIWSAPAPILGIMACELDGRGGWEPWAHPDHCTGGVLSLVVAVRAADGGDYEIDHPLPRWCALQGSAILDLIAMPLSAPRRWARRTGLARTLGRIAYMDPRAATRIFRSPAGWLAGDGSGIAILGRDRGGIASVLRACSGGIEADDADHAREIFNAMAQTTATPRIFLAGRRAASQGAAA